MSLAVENIAAEAPIRVDPIERLFAPVRATVADRKRLALLVAVILGLHLALFGVAFVLVGDDPTVQQEQEIAVDLVPPPEQQPPPPEQQKREEPKPEEKQQAQKPPPPDLDLTPAQDAPRAPTEETVDRKAPDKKTQAPQVARPAEQGVQGQSQEPPSEARTRPAPAEGPLVENNAPDKPDAETIEHAEVKPENLRRFTSPDQKVQNGASVPSIAQMMARLDPIPDYQISGAAKPAPVSGGTAKPNYLSILYGMIVPRFQRPAIRKTPGKIVIYINTVGQVLHQGVLQPSGSPELDNAAMAAVRRAAPFPNPPAGLPPVVWSYE